MLSVEALVLALAGLVAGATGSWSPCGFSMIDTLGGRGRRLTGAACAAFALGTPVGGVVTFGGLALVGSLLQGGGRALAAAAAIALTGALLEAGGVRIVPQIRRQVPERWRWIMPLPAAGFLYGVLLGMGFTTYVLSFAVPALAGVTAAAADPRLGLVVGLAFGVGRALPIVGIAPFVGRDAGARALTLMADRPGLLRGARMADAVALAGCALVLGAGAAQAAKVVASPATDPSVDGLSLAWQVPGGPGRLMVGSALQDLGGAHPALGDGAVAWTTATTIELTAPDGSHRSLAVPGVNALAVDVRRLVWRVGPPDRLTALDLADPAAVPRVVASVAPPGSIGRPALVGDVLAYPVAGRHGSRIRGLNLATGDKQVLRRQSRALLSQVALGGRSLLYVRQSVRGQQLRLGRATPGLVGHDRVLLRIRSTTHRDSGHQPGYSLQGRLREDRHSRPLRPSPFTLWTTALGGSFAYVTRLRAGGGPPEIVRVAR